MYAAVNFSSVHKFTWNVPPGGQIFTTLPRLILFLTFLPFSQKHYFQDVRMLLCCSADQRLISSDLSNYKHFVYNVFLHQHTFFSSVPWRNSHHSCLFLLAELFVLCPTRSSSSHISSSFSPWENRDSLAVVSLPLLSFEGRGEQITFVHFVCWSVFDSVWEIWRGAVTFRRGNDLVWP